MHKGPNARYDFGTASPFSALYAQSGANNKFILNV